MATFKKADVSVWFQVEETDGCVSTKDVREWTEKLFQGLEAYELDPSQETDPYVFANGVVVGHAKLISKTRTVEGQEP